MKDCEGAFVLVACTHIGWVLAELVVVSVFVVIVLQASSVLWMFSVLTFVTVTHK